MRHAVIMAGGSGTRLWPLSRESRPKQILRIAGKQSLLRQAYERCAQLLPPEAIYVITGHRHMKHVLRELPEIPSQNLFGEPEGRDTVNAIGLSAAILRKRDPDAIMGVFTADHVITPVDRFKKAVELAYQSAEDHPDALITMGVTPASPEIGFGYVKRGAQVTSGVFKVDRFAEKPNMEVAKRYVSSGNYCWNSGMFTWRADTVLQQLKERLPQSYEGLTRIAGAWDTPEQQERIQSIYPTLMKISVDFAIMEQAPKVLMVEMDCDWVDLGSWASLKAVVGADSDGNVIAAERTVNLGSSGNVLVSEGDHLIATIGIEDLVIVHSEDATLICSKRDAQGLKELVGKIREKYGDQYR